VQGMSSRTSPATHCWAELKELTNTLVRTMYIRGIKTEWEWHTSKSLHVLSVNSDFFGFLEIVILTAFLHTYWAPLPFNTNFQCTLEIGSGASYTCSNK